MASSRKQAKLDGPTQEMDQDRARYLFEEGAILAFFDVPTGTEFGIDYNSWNVGTEFKGVKMIPPGVHFVFYSAVNNSNQAAPRTGFFYNFKPKEVLIKRWDKRMEDIRTEVISAEEKDRIASNKQELDKYLGPYPYESYRKWVSLTNYMTQSLVNRLQPDLLKISSVAELKSEGSTTQSRKEAAEAANSTLDNCQKDESDPRLPFMKRVEGTEIKFTEIPKKKFPDDASPSEISKCSMDHSYVLRTLLSSTYQSNNYDILGEIQFAFICFLLGQVYEGFEQWKQLVHLMCSCDEVMSGNPELFKQFISVLHYHIKEIPEDFFVDIVSRDNFLVSTLRSFFYNLQNCSCEESLKTKGQKFKDNLEKKFKWDFSLEDEDDEPVVVELP